VFGLRAGTCLVEGVEISQEGEVVRYENESFIVVTVGETGWKKSTTEMHLEVGKTSTIDLL
jgi:hypothetical protein